MSSSMEVAVPAETPVPESSPVVDRAASDFAQVKTRLTIGSGAIAFLTATIGPAIAFDITLGLGNDAGSKYMIFFTLFAGGLFLVCWKALSRIGNSALIAIALISTGSFIGYSIARQNWACTYDYAGNTDRIATGTSLTARGIETQHVAKETIANCTDFLATASGDAAVLYRWPGLIGHFLVLYGIFALAWLSLAAFLLAATQRSLRGWRAGQTRRNG